MGEDIEPTTVRHANQNFVDAGGDSRADDLIQDRREHIQPLNREAGFAGVVRMDKMLKKLDLGQSI